MIGLQKTPLAADIGFLWDEISDWSKKIVPSCDLLHQNCKQNAFLQLYREFLGFSCGYFAVHNSRDHVVYFFLTENFHNILLQPILYGKMLTWTNNFIMNKFKKWLWRAIRAKLIRMGAFMKTIRSDMGHFRDGQVVAFSHEACDLGSKGAQRHLRN